MTAFLDQGGQFMEGVGLVGSSRWQQKVKAKCPNTRLLSTDNPDADGILQFSFVLVERLETLQAIVEDAASFAEDRIVVVVDSSPSVILPDEIRSCTLDELNDEFIATWWTSRRSVEAESAIANESTRFGQQVIAINPFDEELISIAKNLVTFWLETINERQSGFESFDWSTLRHHLRRLAQALGDVVAIVRDDPSDPSTQNLLDTVYLCEKTVLYARSRNSDVIPTLVLSTENPWAIEGGAGVQFPEGLLIALLIIVFNGAPTNGVALCRIESDAVSFHLRIPYGIVKPEGQDIYTPNDFVELFWSKMPEICERHKGAIFRNGSEITLTFRRVVR